MLVLWTVVTLELDVMKLKSLVMTLMLVLKISVTLILDVLINPSAVMTLMPVPRTLVIPHAVVLM
jgi:hypothetical protein